MTPRRIRIARYRDDRRPVLITSKLPMTPEYAHMIRARWIEFVGSYPMAIIAPPLEVAS